MGDRGFIPALGGLRGIAALSVVFAHLSMIGAVPTQPFLGAGAIGVMLFFVLSGFLMTHLYLPQKATGAAVAGFARARFARVYPLYAITIIASGVFSAVGLALLYPFPDPESVLAHLALIEGNKVFWTISVEFQFYALFAVFWFVTRGLTQTKDRSVAMALVAIYLVLWVTGAPGERISIVRNGQVFIVGMLAALAVRNLAAGWNAKMLLTGTMLALPLMWGIPLLLWGDDAEPVYRSVILHVSLGVLVWSAAAVKDGAARWLGSRPMLCLGDWSFGIYLLHMPVIWAFNKAATALDIDRFWLVVPVIACVLFLARRSYLSIETPIRLWLTKRPKVLPTEKAGRSNTAGFPV